MQQPEVTLERMRTFVRVAEAGNLSAVARELGVGQSTVTRQIRELETAVGVPLLSRTTRRVAVTDEGADYYANCVRILLMVDHAGDEVRVNRDAPSGKVRISCTADFGIRAVSGIIFDFQDAYPEIGIDLSLSDERVSLVSEGVDLAIRLGPLEDSTMKLRSLGSSRRLLVASPGYLAARGTPSTPADLAAHEGIRMTNIAGSDTLVLIGGEGQRHLLPFGGRFQIDHGLAARVAMAAGRGIAPAHEWLIDDMLADGTLVEVLQGYAPSPVDLNMLVVPERSEVSRVRLVVDFLAERIRSVPGISRR